MTKTVTYEFEDMADILDTLSDTIFALKGFRSLLDLSLHHGGGDLKPDADGVTLLLDQQVRELEQIEEAGRTEFDRLTERQANDDHASRLLSSCGIEGTGPEALQNHLLRYFEDDSGIARISRYIGVERKVVALVLSLAVNPHAIKERPAATQTGEDLDEELSAGSRHGDVIAEKLKEGVDAGRIAQALNLKQTTVERVIDQLLATPPASEPPSDRHVANG